MRMVDSESDGRADDEDVVLVVVVLVAVPFIPIP